MSKRIDKSSCFSCQCAEGYVGILCDVAVRSCDAMKCQNEGVCRQEKGGAVCVCKSGYTGEFCQEKIEVRNVRCYPQSGLD